MVAKSKQDATVVTSIGVDIGKDVFHMVGFDPKFKRLSLESEFKKLPRCIVGMEACFSAHFVSRRLLNRRFDLAKNVERLARVEARTAPPSRQFIIAITAPEEMTGQSGCQMIRYAPR